MPRILRITNRFNLGGPTYNVAYLSKYLAPEFETLLVGGTKDESEEGSEYIVENLGLKPLIIPEMRREINFKNDYLAYKKLKEIIREFKPDIVHTHAAKAGALGRLAAISCGVPVIYHTFHGHIFNSFYFGKLKTAFYKVIEQYLARKSTKIIAISDIQADELVNQHKVFKQEKLLMVPLGFDLQKFQTNTLEKRKSFRERYKIAENEIVISIIGRLVMIKNHSMFLEAIKLLLEKTNKKVRIMIVGDGAERKNIEQKANELKLPFTNGEADTFSTITFTSWIKDIDWVCAGSDIIALTSLDEGTPVSLIEAQAANKPIVSTNVGGIENVVIPGKTALLSENNQLLPFAKNLLEMVENDELRLKMGSLGWEHVKSKFHYTRLVNDVRTSYQQSLATYRK
ncbi:MAG: glycosyltransferase [Bacteroidetes bacterium]|nr:glycosyltransferase [Bacteroidota bacterium]